MKMEMVAMANGMKIPAIMADKPAGAEAYGFAAELSAVAAAAKASETSGSTKVQAAYSSLTPSSKGLLERIKAGQSNEANEIDITKDEWNRLCQELSAAGLLTQDEAFYANPDIVCVGSMDNAVTDANGVVLGWGSSAVPIGPSSGNYLDIDWTGDPLQYLDQRLKALREEQSLLDTLFLADGRKYDTSYLTSQINANQKVSGLVAELLELC